MYFTFLETSRVIFGSKTIKNHYVCDNYESNKGHVIIPLYISFCRSLVEIISDYQLFCKIIYEINDNFILNFVKDKELLYIE